MKAPQALAAGRRSLGLSLDDLSARTRISVERLNAVERADPAKLPSLLYLKGVVRAYAAAVQLEPDAIWRQYSSELPELLAMASVEGSQAAPTQADPLAEFEPDGDGAGPIALGPTAAEVAFVPVAELPPRAAEWEPLDRAATAVIRPSHAPLAPPAGRRQPFPLRFVLAAIFSVVGAYLLSATTNRRFADSDAVPVAAQLSEPGMSSSASAAAHQHPSVSSPMHADSGDLQPARPAPDTAPPPRPRDQRNQTSSATSDGIRNSTSDNAGRPSTGRHTDPVVARGPVGDELPPVTVPPATADPAAITAGEPTGAADTLTGVWNLTSKVEAASFAAYENLMLGFRLDLDQRGPLVVGEGRKVSENGATLPARRRTPIKVTGTLEGNRLVLDFTEVGVRRNSGGRFLLYRADDGSFRGRFSSDAADSSGETVAVRASSSARN